MVNFLPLMLSMGHINEFLHETLSDLVNFSVIMLEFMGLVVIVYTGLNAFLKWVKKDPHTRLYLAEGLAMALSFKLGGEILRTVVVRDMSEIVQVGAVIILRAALTLLIHWEIKNEAAEIEKAQNKHALSEKDNNNRE